MNQRLKKVKLGIAESRYRAVLFITLIALCGVVLLLQIKAATQIVSIEAESGAVMSPAQKLSDTSASGGQAVWFPGTVPLAGSYLLAINGDIGKDAPAAKPTGDHVKSLGSSLAAILVLGDAAYDDGTPAEFASNYDPYWGGTLKSITYPTPGNHEYNTSGASGYYGYFNATATSISGHSVAGRPDKGYYGWNLGANWRFYSLNSETNIDEANSWLDADMKTNPKLCQVAIWHKPPWTTSSRHSAETETRVKYGQTLYNNGGDIVLTGHNHSYESFHPQNPANSARDDARGLRSFVVGTGGDVDGYSFGSTTPNLIFRETGILGNLLMTVKDDGTYSWQFIKVAGTTYTVLETGSGSCHN